MRSEGLCERKIPMIDPATFRFVAQHLNHCATAVPIYIIYIYMYILSSHKLWCMQLGTQRVFLYLFFFRAIRVLGGVSRSYFDYSVFPYGDGYCQYSFNIRTHMQVGAVRVMGVPRVLFLREHRFYEVHTKLQASLSLLRKE